MSSTLENSFIQTAANKSYERLLGETIDAQNLPHGSGNVSGGGGNGSGFQQ